MKKYVFYLSNILLMLREGKKSTCEQNIHTLHELQNKPEACKYPSTSSLCAPLETAAKCNLQPSFMIILFFKKKINTKTNEREELSKWNSL